MIHGDSSVYDIGFFFLDLTGAHGGVNRGVRGRRKMGKEKVIKKAC